MMIANPASTKMIPKEYCTNSGGASVVGCHPGTKSLAVRGVAASPITIKSSATRNAMRGESCDFEFIGNESVRLSLDDYHAIPCRGSHCASMGALSMRLCFHTSG